MANNGASVTATDDTPNALTIPKLPTRDTMTDEQYHAIMEKGYWQAMAGQTLGIDDAFAQIRESI